MTLGYFERYCFSQNSINNKKLNTIFYSYLNPNFVFYWDSNFKMRIPWGSMTSQKNTIKKGNLWAWLDPMWGKHITPLVSLTGNYPTKLLPPKSLPSLCSESGPLYPLLSPNYTPFPFDTMSHSLCWWFCHSCSHSPLLLFLHLLTDMSTNFINRYLQRPKIYKILLSWNQFINKIEFELTFSFFL